MTTKFHGKRQGPECWPAQKASAVPRGTSAGGDETPPSPGQPACSLRDAGCAMGPH